MIRKIVITLWALLALAMFAGFIIFLSISKGWIGYMPPVEDLENPNYKFATEVFQKMEKYLVLTLIARKIVYMWVIRTSHPILSMR